MPPVFKHSHRTIISRDFSEANLHEFRDRLEATDWNHVYNQLEVDTAYEEFWSTYNTIFNQTFQLKRQRFIKNIHETQKFMTNGLLISRKTKNNLHKTSVSNPTLEILGKFKNFKTVYQRVISAAKKTLLYL